MARDPVLVVMAAGMGSRYGGLKQIDPVGSHGEAILDYSLFDAYAAGFRTAVIIIKEAIREEFMHTVGARLAHCPMEIRYAYQELTDLPEGLAVPEGRSKPWGTCHAVYCARQAIGDAPFAVINADDYYGKLGFQAVYDFLRTEQTGHTLPFCMVAYEMGKTITDSGSVARGICQVENGKLQTITERTRIEKREGGIYFTEDGENWVFVAADTPVSMNLWGFPRGAMAQLQARTPLALAKILADNPMRGEFYLPKLISDLLEEGKADVTVLRSADQWYGVTYAADKPMVQAAIQNMTAEGKYPDGLWK